MTASETDPAWLSRRRLLRRAAELGAAGILIASGTAGAGEYEERVKLRELGSMHVASGALLPHATRVFWRPTTTDKVIALTFDDGPSKNFTRSLLNILDEAEVKATFCIVGFRALQHQDLVQSQFNGHHELVNHTWSHQDLSQLDAPAIRSELARTDDVIERLTGQRPRLVRPPYGRLSGLALRCVAEAGHDVLMWNELLHDRRRSTSNDVQEILLALSPGAVVLGHDQGPTYRRVGLSAVPGIISGARARGYKFVTASEMFGLHGD